MSWTLAGQDPALRSLRGAIDGDRVSHAYLFVGPKHVGKTVAALQFAQALNCTGEEPPCGRCRACERIAAGAHPDVEMVTIGGLCDDPEHKSHTTDDSRQIRICQVRRLERLVAMAPYEARTRVMIIEPADALGFDATPALLKTLEEPPPRVVMILVTDREEMLLPTIRSRTRRVAFGGLPKATIEQALRTRWDAEPEAASELARLSGGRLGWAVRGLHDATLLSQRREALDTAEEMASAGLGERFAFAAKLGDGYTRNRATVQATLEVWQEWWRDVLLVASGRPEGAVHRERLDRTHALAAQCPVRSAVRALRAITDVRQQLEENASPVLALEAMMLALPRLRRNAVAERLAKD